MSQENTSERSKRKADLEKAVTAYQGAIDTFVAMGIENLGTEALKAYYAAVNGLNLARAELNRLNSAN